MPAVTKPAPYELLSTVCHRLRTKHPDMTPEAVVELVLGVIVVDPGRQVPERTFVEALILYNSAANGDSLIRVKANWQDWEKFERVLNLTRKGDLEIMQKEKLNKLEPALSEAHAEARDLSNKYTGQQQKLDGAKRREAIFDDAVKALKEESASTSSLEETVAKLTAEKTSLEHTNKALREDTKRVKLEWQAETAKLEAVKQERASLESEVEAAKAHIARGEEVARILASIGTH